MKTLAIIGSTGSIGRSSLNVIKRYRKCFKIEFLYAKENYRKLNSQYKIFKPNFISLEEKSLLSQLKVPKNKILTIENFLKRKKKIDYIISATSGFSGLDINFQLLKICRNLLIANKESIICGGKFFLKSAQKNYCKILPIDSEHYCISFFLNNFSKINHTDYINNFYLTASGGPFLKKKPHLNVSIKEVLKHPNWKMGKKISVNSSNMTNKIMELFEAHFLFNIKPNKLNIKIEDTSKIHSVVSLKNGLDLYISHNTNMEIPIKNSLISNSFYLGEYKNLILSKKINFSLSDPDKKKFPIINTGYKVLKLGHRAMIIFIIVNDRLVEMFLKKKIKFNDISTILIKVFKKFEIVQYSKQGIRSYLDIKKTIEFGKSIKL